MLTFSALKNLFFCCYVVYYFFRRNMFLVVMKPIILAGKLNKGRNIFLFIYSCYEISKLSL